MVVSLVELCGWVGSFAYCRGKQLPSTRRVPHLSRINYCAKLEIYLQSYKQNWGIFAASQHLSSKSTRFQPIPLPFSLTFVTELGTIPKSSFERYSSAYYREGDLVASSFSVFLFSLRYLFAHCAFITIFAVLRWNKSIFCVSFNTQIPFRFPEATTKTTSRID